MPFIGPKKPPLVAFQRLKVPVVKATLERKRALLDLVFATWSDRSETLGKHLVAVYNNFDMSRISDMEFENAIRKTYFHPHSILPDPVQGERGSGKARREKEAEVRAASEDLYRRKKAGLPPVDPPLAPQANPGGSSTPQGTAVEARVSRAVLPAGVLPDPIWDAAFMDPISSDDISEDD